MNRGPHRILVVDDDQDTCRNLADILEDAGYIVAMADNASRALASVIDAPFDLVLLDLKLPDGDGVSLFHQIKRVSLGTLVVIITAHAFSETASAALAAGALNVLAKPVDVRALLSLVKATMARPLVLVVDDDADLCANLVDLFRVEGLRAAVAHGGQEAARALEMRDHPVVLIDMKLPSGSGAAVYPLVRRHNPNASTIVMTGYRAEFEQRVEEMLAMGADTVCYKPFDAGMLLATIKGLIGRRPQG